jgi:hypothetical protein
LSGAVLASCASEGAPSVRSDAAVAAASASVPSLLHDATALGHALALATGPLSKPIRALSLRVYPDRVLLQVQDPQQPSAVNQYRVRAGDVHGPIAVKLGGPGQLKDNLFPLSYADLSVIPSLVQRAERQAALPDGKTLAVSLARNLPASMDIRFQVDVESPRGRRVIEARKDGKVLGVRPAP